MPRKDLDVSLREAGLDDAAALAELTSQLGYASTSDQMGARLEAILGQPDRTTVVAERSGRLVGYAGAWCGASYETDAPHARLLVIAVDERVRRQGVATRLADVIEAWARARGAAYIVLGSGAHRADAHAFYERLGYVSRGRRYRKSLQAPG